MKRFLLLKHSVITICLLFFISISSFVYATDRYVPSGGAPSYPTIQDAIDASSAGDIIHVAAGTYVIGTRINVNKSVTIDGGSSATTKLQTSGTDYLFLVTAANVSITNFEIEKTDAGVSQNIIGVQANNFQLGNVNEHGTFVIGNPEVTRGLEISPSVTGINIHDNTFKSLRQPAYINPGVTGTVANNLTSITKGWVVSSNSNVTFTNNTWGTGANVNVLDISIFSDGGVNNYPDIVTMSANNNDAVIENQFYSPPILSIVHVQASAPAGGDGTILKPYNTIAPSVPRVAPGGKVIVASGAYNENVTINKSLRLFGANYGVSCSAGRGTESSVNGTTGSQTATLTVQANNVTIDGFTITNPTGSFGVLGSANSNLDIEHNIITNVGNSTTGAGSSYGVDFEVGNSTNSSGLTISNNCISAIRGGANTTLNGSAAKSNNGSGGAIFIGSSNATKNVSAVTITANKIDNITASTSAFTDGGKGAYGLLLDAGATAAGAVVSPQILNNEITNLEGLWAHAVGLEGRTSGAMVLNNFIDKLVDHKGNTDAIGVLLQDNDQAASIAINNNSFTNMAYGIVNATSPTVNGTCNWWGTTSASAIAAKTAGPVQYQPWLVDGTDNSSATGFQPKPNTCSGGAWYVNDTYVAGSDHYTTATGNDATGDGSTSKPFRTMTKAISAASSGDYIFVDAGTYTEVIDITKSVKLFGSNRDVSPVNPAPSPNRAGGFDESVVISPVAAVKDEESATFKAHTSGVTTEINGFQVKKGRPLTDAHYPRSASDPQNIVIVFKSNWVSSGSSTLFCGSLTRWLNVTITDNYFNGINGIPGTPTTGSSAIQLNDASGLPATMTAVINDNKINTTTFAGILLDNIANATVLRNIIRAVPDAGIQVADGMGTTLISQNDMQNTNTSNGVSNGGIRLYNTTFTGPITISNNAVRSSKNGFAIQSGDITGKNIHVNNNSFNNTNTLSIYNGATGTLDGECNFNGASSHPAIDARFFGSVDFSPFILVGTDAQPDDPNNPATEGFQPAGACTGVIANKKDGGEDKVITALPVAFKVSVLPNPSSSTFTLRIESPVDDAVQINIVDAAGRIVDSYAKVIPNSTLTFGNKLMKGLYYAQITQGKNSQLLKLVKL